MSPVHAQTHYIYTSNFCIPKYVSGAHSYPTIYTKSHSPTHGDVCTYCTCKEVCGHVNAYTECCSYLHSVHSHPRLHIYVASSCIKLAPYHSHDTVHDSARLSLSCQGPACGQGWGGLLNSRILTLPAGFALLKEHGTGPRCFFARRYFSLVCHSAWQKSPRREKSSRIPAPFSPGIASSGASGQQPCLSFCFTRWLPVDYFGTALQKVALAVLVEWPWGKDSSSYQPSKHIPSAFIQQTLISS